MTLNQKNDGGPVAQLGEHLVCNQGVRGSSPLRSTKLPCHEGGALGAPAGGEQKAKQDGAVPGRPAFSPDRTLPHDSAL